jgi:hypothetical protein
MSIVIYALNSYSRLCYWHLITNFLHLWGIFCHNMHYQKINVSYIKCTGCCVWWNAPWTQSKQFCTGCCVATRWWDESVLQWFKISYLDWHLYGRTVINMVLYICSFPFEEYVIILLVCCMVPKEISYLWCAFSSVNAEFWALQMKELG